MNDREICYFRRNYEQMQSIYFKVLFSLFILGCVSCKKRTTYENNGERFNTLQKANWLLGKWENQSKNGLLTENWYLLNDSTFSGKGYLIFEGDTVFAEDMQIIARSGTISYVVTVDGQNESKPISFVLTKSNSGQMAFENLKHDFPKKIIYNHIGDDSLVAEISGTDNNKPRKEVFRMKRVRN